MNKFSWQKVLPYLLAIPIFYLVTAFYFKAEVFDGLHLSQGDIVQFEGMKKLSDDYTKSHDGEAPLWNVAMFAGFPEYLLASIPDGPLEFASRLTKGFFNESGTASVFFLCMTMFWAMLLCFGVSPYLAMFGGIAFAFNTFHIVSTEAGHMTKMWAIGYSSVVLGGMALVFRKKYLLGFGVFALALALQMRAAHYQITYYLIFVCAIYGISELVFAVKEKRISEFVKMSAILVVAIVLAGLTQTARLWMTQEYSKYSTRGKAELTSQSIKQGEDGLDKDYAFSWSQGKFETFTLMIPYFYGGSSHERPTKDGAFAEVLGKIAGKQQAERLIKDKNFRLPMYFGDQPFTAGPMYMGAIFTFLFILGMLVLDNRHRWWMLSAVILMLMFCWGRNLQWFNYFMFDYFPGFNKFRTVAMALSLGSIIMPLAGIMGLQKVLEGKGTYQKPLLIATGVVGGLALCFMVFTGMIDTSTPNDMALFRRSFGIQDQNVLKQLVTGLNGERAGLIRSDAIRTLVLVLLSAVAVLLVMKGKLKKNVAVVVIGVLMVGDVWLVAKRYLDNDSYSKQTSQKAHVMSPADKQILKDKSYHRVLNFAGNPFSEARTSYFHHSIGGYFAAKMRRYQDLIERQLVNEQQYFISSLQGGKSAPKFDNLTAINMLNTKYFKIGNQAKDVVRNPNALGNVWFVNKVISVKSPDEEMAALGKINPIEEAVVDVEKFKVSAKSFNVDSTSVIKLNSFDNRKLVYSSKAGSDALAVFSEIYYPEGWEVKIDDKPAQMIRANYVLRALEVPAGEHKITFEFKPDAYLVGVPVTQVASWIVFAGFVIAVGLTVAGGMKKEEKE